MATKLKFDPGRIVMTPGAMELFQKRGTVPSLFLKRHVTGDWGDLDSHDKSQNEGALKLGGRLMSAYKLTESDTVWIITEGVPEDEPTPQQLFARQLTTLLLPSDY